MRSYSRRPNLEAVESQLDALSGTLDAGATGYLEGTLEGDAADARLREVLNDSAFNYEEQMSLLQRLVQWLSQFTGSSDPDSNFSRLLMALLAGLAAGALTFLASDRIRNRWARLGLSVLVGTLVGALFLAGLRDLDMTFSVLAVVGLVVAAVAMGLFTLGLNRGTTASSTPRAVSDLAAVLGMNSAEARRRAMASAAGGRSQRDTLRCLGAARVEAGKSRSPPAQTGIPLSRLRSPDDELQPSSTASMTLVRQPPTDSGTGGYSAQAIG